MANASPNPVFEQNVVILNHHMAEVARDIAAGNLGDAAASLEAIGKAAIWLSQSLTGGDPRSLPPQMLPAQNCRPKMIDPSKIHP